jgi:uncharacterized protein (TIGR02452 family)
LYISLTTDTGQPFYALHAGKGKNKGFYSHAMIYSPEVHLFRDDSRGWLDALQVDVVTSSPVDAGEVMRCFPYRDGRLEKVKVIEDVMRERMGRILALFELKGATSLVLGAFGVGGPQNDVEVVGRIWSELLLRCDARFRSSFTEVAFCIPNAQTREVFERTLVLRASSVHDGGGEDSVPDA